jgi:prepilin-type N-terminal cleavage/methylation domain-containing protein
VWRASRPNGFTLTEVTVALAIVGAAGASALALSGAYLRAATVASETLEAAVLAEHLIALTELQPPGDLGNGRFVEGVFVASLGGYRYAVSTVPVEGRPTLYAVQVTLEWDRGTFRLDGHFRSPIGDVAAQDGESEP